MCVCVFVLCLCVIMCVCITVSVCSDKRIQVSLIQHTSPMSLCLSVNRNVHLNTILMRVSLWEISLVPSVEGWKPRDVWWWMNDRKRGDFKICSSGEGKRKKRVEKQWRETVQWRMEEACWVNIQSPPWLKYFSKPLTLVWPLSCFLCLSFSASSSLSSFLD